jgi:hypothetical protein
VQPVRGDAAPLHAFLDCWLSLDWLPIEGGKGKRREREQLIDAWIDGVGGDPVELAQGKPARGKDAAAIGTLLSDARAIAAQRRFLHWQPAYHGVWETMNGHVRQAGVDS